MAIDVHSRQQAPPKPEALSPSGSNYGVIFELWLDTEDDVDDLPPPGSWAANTSIAFIKSTGRVLALGNDGWSDI